MSSYSFHLGWFQAGFRAPAWNREWSGHSTRDWATGGFFVDLARDLERGCFDFMLIEDSNYIPDDYGNSYASPLKHGHRAPKHDPLALAAVLSQHTSRLGIIPTVATTEISPFRLARAMSTLDHLSAGRIGWNIVTGSNDRAAQNFGFDAQPAHDQRYERADEFVAVVRSLWQSWEPDAVLLDQDTGVYVDAAKVHTVNHQGTYFKSRGPLNTLPSPQYEPVLAQAGNSPRGQLFAAQHAEVVLAGGSDHAKMRALRDNVRSQAERLGRDPEGVKVFFLIDPVLGETDNEAKEKAKRIRDANANDLEYVLSNWSSTTTTDLSQFDPDQPLPEDLKTNGHQSQLDGMVSSGKTLRQLVRDSYAHEENGFVGRPDTVAARMQDAAAEIGADGFLLSTRMPTRRYLSEVVDGLVPALQRRGAVRTSYRHETFRANLLDGAS
ncbi:NtaA/DmoA family FMN-dependent monooxygenase [Occultella aeris]|uniref:Dimethyl-sulfide monooxygenase n=1 Tax=Occultella aeris TaxID=2761496 RepID=A0A7M4DPK0_9MICO|nr:NtaA/DmoA family FMN-dependent monooxygenase [Occultella aeris]VZO39394.1 Dimethyl-sulfide monooxygenase [Occultella aeris]